MHRNLFGGGEGRSSRRAHVAPEQKPSPSGRAQRQTKGQQGQKASDSDHKEDIPKPATQASRWPAVEQSGRLRGFQAGRLSGWVGVWSGLVLSCPVLGWLGLDRFSREARAGSAEAPNGPIWPLGFDQKTGEKIINYHYSK